MTWFRRSAHPEVELSAYVDGELDERARRALETHLASCEACSALLRELQDAKLLLSELPRVAPTRSFTLGAEHAREYRPAPAPSRRMSFSFAPAVALTVLVALLFVDAANFSGGGADDEATFGASNGTASRQSAPEAAGGLALEAEADKADEAGADAAAPAADGEAGGAAASSAAPPEESQPTEEPEDLQTFSADSAEDDTEIAAAPAGGPEDTHVLGTDDSGGDLSTLRILEIVAGIAFVASLAAVFLPRLAGRRER